MMYASPKDRDAALPFFRDRPLAQSLYEQVGAYVDTLGPVKVVAARSRVSFLARTRFLWIHEATREGIWLGFLAPARVVSRRVRAGPVGKRWSHHVKLTAPLDDELREWISVAHAADVAPR